MTALVRLHGTDDASGTLRVAMALRATIGDCTLSSILCPTDRFGNPRSDTLVLAESILERTGRSPRAQAIVVAEAPPDWHKSSLTSSTWACTLSMLILATPELFWILCLPGKDDRPLALLQPMQHWNYVQGLTLSDEGLRTWALETWFLIKNGLDPRTDPCGLRNGIRERTLESWGRNAHWPQPLPKRTRQCYAIDEESQQAVFSAYVAYRSGARCLPVSSLALFERVFGLRLCLHVGEEGFTFEDIHLAFGDDRDTTSDPRKATVSRSLSARDRKYPRLAKLHRFFVTVTASRPLGSADQLEIQQENEEYAETLRRLRRRVSFVQKPFGGMFALARPLGPNWQAPDIQVQAAAGTSGRPAEAADDGEHAAEGKLSTIAGHLLDRASRLLPQATTVPDCLHGALLALDAQELLGGKNWTSSLRAILLKHTFETRAECLFSGVQSKSDTDERIRSVRRELTDLADQLAPEKRRESLLDSQVTALNTIRSIYGEFGQVDERDNCMHATRSIELALWWERKTAWVWRRPRWQAVALTALLAVPILLPSALVFALRWYVHKLVASVWGFAVVVAGWFAIWLGCFRHSCPVDDVSPKPWLHALVDALTGYIGLQPPHPKAPESTLYELTIVGAMLTGFMHLGVFISYVYSAMTRTR